MRYHSLEYPHFNTKDNFCIPRCRPFIKNGIVNNILLGSLGATLLTFIGFFLGYLSEKIRSGLRNSMAAFIWIFFAVPATVSGIGLIKLWNRRRLHSNSSTALYGS